MDTTAAMYAGLGSLATAVLVGVGALAKDWFGARRLEKQDVVAGLWQLIDRLEKDRNERAAEAAVRTQEHDECERRFVQSEARFASAEARIGMLEDILTASGIKFPQSRPGGSGTHPPLPPGSGGGP